MPPLPGDPAIEPTCRTRVVGFRSRAWLLSWGSALVFAALFTATSLRRHAQLLTTGYDLGIFEQGVRAYSEGRLPTSLLKGIDYPLLGDHFSPALAALAPLYALFPRPELLLVAQAVLVAVGVVPLTTWAARSLGLGSAAVVAISYGFAGGLAHAICFDFHEVAFAVPLLAFSVTALGERRLFAAASWAVPLVLVKEDLGVTVAAIGMLIAVRADRSDRRGRLLGVGSMLFGLAATAVESLVVIPAVNPSGSNSYTGQLELGEAFTRLVGFPGNHLQVTTVVLLLLPTAFVALRSPMVLVAVPTLAWRFLSDNPHYWGHAFHYDAVLVPIVTAAFIDGLRGLRSAGGWSHTSYRLVLLGSLAATAALLTVSPLAQVVSPTLWQSDDHVVAARSVLAQIPDGATVAASNSLAPQLTGRADVSLLGILPLETSRPLFVVADTSIADQFPLDGDQLADLLTSARRAGYHLLAAESGVVLLGRG